MKGKIGVVLVLILAILNTASAGVQIEEVGKYTASGGGRAIVVDEYAYMLGSDNLYIIDWYQDISRPIKVGQCGISGYDIATFDGYAYVAGPKKIPWEGVEYLIVGYEMHVIDISNPYNPVKVGQCNLSWDRWCVAVSNNHAYIGGKGLEIVDISDPHNPTKIGEYESISTNGIAASGDYIYVADSNIDGLVIIDVSEPFNPQKIAQISRIGGDNLAYREISSVWESSKYVYLLGNDFYVIDVSYPSEPRIVGVGNLGHGDEEPFAVGEKFAYVSNSEVHGWSVHDISDPSNPEYTGGYLLSGMSRYDVAASSDYAFVTSSEGLVIFKVIETGHISISSSESGADVYIDGEYKDTIPANLYPYSTGFDLPVGEHTIKLTKLGYNDWETTKYVYANEGVYVSATLTPQPGSISISSVPAGAKIYLDGEYKGTTPKTISDVSVGSHTLELNKEDYQSWSTSVYVTSGDTETVSASMNVLSAATPTIIPTPAFTPYPTPTPVRTPTPSPVDSDGDGVPDQYDYDPYDPDVQTKSDIETPGFEAVFAIAGLLTVSYLLRKRNG